MKKFMKRISLALIGVCVLLLSQVMISFAADGSLQFSDPTGKVGEEITIAVKMSANGAAIGDGNATLHYDSAMLEFVSGTNATGGDGVVTLSASGTGTETELDYSIVFKALAEGTTTLEVSDSTAYLYSDETLNLDHGTSTVTIGAGDGVAQATAAGGDGTVELAGIVYNIYNDFTEALIPDGFSKTVVTYNNADYNAVAQDVSGIKFVFLKSGDSNPIMAMYNDSDNEFTLAEEVALTSDQYIYILDMTKDVKLPAEFGETTMELYGRTFPVWQDSENREYFLVKALGPSGEITFYQYDTTDKTYQRYVARKDEAKGTETENKKINKVVSFVEKNMMIIGAVILAIILLLILIIIILSAKLRRVNDELDELYDEYEGQQMPSQSKSREQFLGDDDDYEMESDDYMEEDYDAESDEYADYDYDDYEFEDDYEDDYEEELVVERRPAKSSKKKKSKKDYDIEFIDL